MINKNRYFSAITLSVFVFFAFFGFSLNLAAQDKDKKPKLSSEAKRDRDYALGMLDEMEKILNEYYYDPKMHGIDLKARVVAAKERVKTMQYNWQMFRVLVQLLMDFNDSHTVLSLPPRSDYFDYGFRTQMIGNECFVISVKKDSDAEKKGLEVGDQILQYGKFKPNRRDLWKMNYVLYKLDPANTLDLKTLKPDGAEKSFTITAKTMTDKEYRAERKARKEKNKFEPYKCQEVSKEIIACKLYSFVVEKTDIDKMMKQAANYPKLILDLRGNGGGYVLVEQYLLSHFFNREIKIADLVTKEKTETRITKPVGNREYKGELIVLVDSNSASAAEMTAKVLQLEKRALVFGDISSGSVMTSIRVPFRSLMGALADAAIINTSMSVTIADVIMRDGSRLENVGVIPDQVLLPTALGLKQKTDPVLAVAAYKFGYELSPEKAGSFHFITEDTDGDNDQSEDN